MRIRPLFLKLLVALLLLQWGTAFAHCLKAASLHGTGLGAMTICTSEGLVSVALEAGDQAAGHQDEASAALCPACQGAGQAALPAPPVSLAPPVVLAQQPDAPPPAPGADPPPRSCRPPPPRAPPVS